MLPGRCAASSRFHPRRVGGRGCRRPAAAGSEPPQGVRCPRSGRIGAVTGCAVPSIRPDRSRRRVCGALDRTGSEPPHGVWCPRSGRIGPAPGYGVASTPGAPDIGPVGATRGARHVPDRSPVHCVAESYFRVAPVGEPDGLRLAPKCRAARPGVEDAQARRRRPRRGGAVGTQQAPLVAEHLRHLRAGARREKAGNQGGCGHETQSRHDAPRSWRDPAAIRAARPIDT